MQNSPDTPTAPAAADPIPVASRTASPSSTPHSEFPIPHSDDPQSDPLTDLSTLLRIAQSAERRLEVFFGDDNPTFNYLDKFNDGIQALWRLVAIRKALIRLDNEIKNPHLPRTPDPSPFGVQASACPAGFDASTIDSAPTTSSTHTSDKSDKSDSSSPIAHSQLHVTHFSLNSNSPSNSPIPSPPSPSIPTLTIPNIPAVPDIPAARLTDVKTIHARLDELEAAMARRIAERIKWGFPAIPYFPIYPKPAPGKTPAAPPASSDPQDPAVKVAQAFQPADSASQKTPCTDSRDAAPPPTIPPRATPTARTKPSSAPSASSAVKSSSSSTPHSKFRTPHSKAPPDP